MWVRVKLVGTMPWAVQGFHETELLGKMSFFGGEEISKRSTGGLGVFHRPKVISGA